MADLKVFFNEEACDRCGDCLAECPVIHLSQAEAQREIGRLIDGGESKAVLDHCSTCFACNHICTKGANPYGLILFRWFERYQRKGLPGRGVMALPLSPGNFFQVLMQKAPSDEQRVLREWHDLSRNELASNPQLMFAGCNLKMAPYYTFSSLYDDLPIFTAPDLCCGEVYFRMGILEKAESQAHYLEERYRALNLKKVVYFCLAGYNMMQNLLPQYFGVSFDFDKVYLLDYLYQKIERGEIKIDHRAEGTVTVQDPCHAKTLGQDFMDTPRRLLQELGYSVLEMGHTRELALCCGFGNGAGRYSPVDIIAWSLRRLGEARKTGAQMLVTYCSVCQLYLSVARKLYPKAPPVYHVLDLLQMAIGEQPALRHSERANKMIKYMTFGLPRIVSPRRSWVEI
ncbi:hypothetical protein ES703_08035 [subsurface metagenome]